MNTSKKSDVSPENRTVKHISVACGIIMHNGRVLATQRSKSMSLPLKWEFPGGKIEPEETASECVQREVLEELGMEVSIVKELVPVTHRYTDFSVTLYPFLCNHISGQLTLHEHADACWLTPYELSSLDWADADWPIINSLTHIL